MSIWLEPLRLFDSAGTDSTRGITARELQLWPTAEAVRPLAYCYGVGPAVEVHIGTQCDRSPLATPRLHFCLPNLERADAYLE